MPDREADQEARLRHVETEGAVRGERLASIEGEVRHIRKVLEEHLRQEDIDRRELQLELRQLREEVVRAHGVVGALLWVVGAAAATVAFFWDRVVAWVRA